MAINFEDAFFKNYMDTMYPMEPDTEQAPEVQLASANTGVTTDGGAFVGYRMNVPKGLNTPENMAKQSTLIANTLGGSSVGIPAAATGLAGDIVDIILMGANALGANAPEKSGIWTTEDVTNWLASKGINQENISELIDKVLPSGATEEEKARAFSGGQTVGEFVAPGTQLSLIGKAGKGIVKGGVEVGKKIIEAGKDLPVGMSIKMVDGTDAVVPKAPQINTPEFNNWFGGSKVVDDSGVPIAVYHGTGRPDRVGEQFRKSRATSGPMSFFTDNPEVASGYAKGKTDTSIAYEDDAFDYKNWFKKKVGRENLNLEQVGARMSAQEKQDVIEKLRNIGTDDEGNIIVGQGLVADSTFDFMLKDSREANGNPLKLANRLWLESGQLYGKEEEFAKVLNLAGVKGFDYNDPHAKFPFVYKVFLSIKNPLDTSNIGEDIIQSLEQASKRVRKPTQSGGADNWDKNTVDPKVWIERLKSDQAEGTTYAWTSIPDWVTKTLKAKGFDGIKDSGGKGGGTNHNVWIPFEENQVKSALGNKGTFSESKNIMRGIGVGGTGTAMSQEENK